MTSLPLLAALAVAVAVTWATRTVVILFRPAQRLPARVTGLLEASTPAVLGALTVATLLHVRATGPSLLALAVPVAVAAVLAARRANLAVVVLGAIAVGTATSMVVG